jgi:imidazole glycerol-phosphate synthase subunit HisF
MPFQRLIPTLLIDNARLVKGHYYGDYKDAGAPATTARAHNHQGADELIVVDINAAKNGRGPDLESISNIAVECEMPLCVCGGISNLKDAMKLMDAGADKLMITSGALDRPDLISELATHYGSQAIVLGLDTIRTDEGKLVIYDHRTGKIASDLSPVQWAVQAVSLGAGEIRIMSVDREGSLGGYDFELYHQLSECVEVPLLLEGGAGTLDHLADAFNSGVDGVCVGAMLVFSDSNLVKIKQHMISRGINIRR